MIRINKWPGLITSASPYMLPAGGAVEQTNCQSIYPGQLSVRGGMANVSFSTEVEAEPIVEAWGYSPGAGASDSVFVVNALGEIYRITGISMS